MKIENYNSEPLNMRSAFRKTLRENLQFFNKAEVEFYAQHLAENLEQMSHEISSTLWTMGNVMVVLHVCNSYNSNNKKVVTVFTMPLPK